MQRSSYRRKTIGHICPWTTGSILGLFVMDKLLRALRSALQNTNAEMSFSSAPKLVHIPIADSTTL